MRIGSLHMVSRYQKQLNTAAEEQARLMEQSDGQSLHRPSDDPVRYSNWLRYGTEQNENEQYKKNVEAGKSWMQRTDGAVSGMADIFKTLKEKTIQAAQSPHQQTDMAAIAKEMTAKLHEIVSLGNSQQGDRYIFSGQSDLTQPFLLSEKKVARGIPKTLDDQQSKFFSNTNVSGRMKQMITLQGDDKNEYYLDTKTGDVYSYDFMKDGYKKKVAAGQAEVNPAADRAGNVGAFNVADNFLNTGQIKDASTTPPAGAGQGAGWTKSITVNGQTVNLKLKTVDQQIVKYQGDFKQISMVKKNGAVEPTADTVNATAGDIFGTDIFDDENSGNTRSGTAALNDMLTVAAKVDSSDVNWLISDGVTLADESHNNVVIAQDHIAARHNVYKGMADILDDYAVSIKQDISDTNSTDVAKLAVQLMQASAIYNMSLSVGSRILPPTLTDYLR
ncbi:flagellar hook-associated protein FlgL [uncultured Selenomonas sp.]|uniref:flagellar hook-associated protein FlgL n=1 Tax=uncultured Selenomonas sp. TaxID=159275 RepID=UPI0026175368|nr:flagellar hook-associated protein FlgL [uncultured Selenomonas sp.]